MAAARIRRNVGGAHQRSMGSLNQPRVSWSRQEANWEVLISPTSCLLSRSEEETTINSGRAGKTAYSALLRFGGGKKKKKVIPTTSGFFFAFRRPDSDYSVLFVLRSSDNISTLCAEWCIIQKWPSNGQVETKYGFRWMKNLTASTPLTAWNIL